MRTTESDSLVARAELAEFHASERMAERRYAELGRKGGTIEDWEDLADADDARYARFVELVDRIR